MVGHPTKRRAREERHEEGLEEGGSRERRERKQKLRLPFCTAKLAGLVRGPVLPGPLHELSDS